MKPIYLKKGKEINIYRKHPWVFSGAIRGSVSNFEDGDIVKVFSADEKPLAIAYYQSTNIALRILSFDPSIEIDQAYWDGLISVAYASRTHLNTDTNNVFRLFFGEGDGCPGLVLDYYANNVVVEMHQPSLYQFKDQIVSALSSVFEDLDTVFLSYKDFYFTPRQEYLKGESASVVALENGISFNVNWALGQKTGFFIDQRDNRALIADLSKGKSVLNTFCYTGGFSLAALKGGAKKVVSVDVSKPAIEQLELNLPLNDFDTSAHESVAQDTFEYLKAHDIGEFDIVILDPPAYAKHVKNRHKAVIGYKKLNAKALRDVKKGALILTFSCSQVVGKDLFEHTIRSAAMEANRRVQLVSYLDQPSDHPVMLDFPEGQYLKGLLLKVVD